MRHKKNLEPRMQACSDLYTDLKHGEIEEINVGEIFKRDAPLHIEIGCGKGQFITELAIRNPDINYIAVELVDNVIVSAMENVKSQGITNVYFLVGNAQNLYKALKKDSVSQIYLNFSCPYPKNRYAKHRLTHSNFLNIYRDLLVKDGEIHMKTDNASFFEFSLNSFSECDYKLKNITFDLHNSKFEGNIITEYENRFASQGLPIYRLEAINRK